MRFSDRTAPSQTCSASKMKLSTTTGVTGVTGTVSDERQDLFISKGQFFQIFHLLGLLCCNLAEGWNELKNKDLGDYSIHSTSQEIIIRQKFYSHSKNSSYAETVYSHSWMLLTNTCYFQLTFLRVNATGISPCSFCWQHKSHCFLKVIHFVLDSRKINKFSNNWITFVVSNFFT